MKIRMENIKKFYNNNLILDIPHIEIPCNEITGIIGPNGSGKSTMMKIIAGLIKPEEGSVFYDDKICDDKIMKDMTYLSHDSYLFNTTVFSNISYPLKIRKYCKKDITEITNNLIKELGIEDLKNSNALKLSGGESQKTAMARALSINPSLLLLDEPTTNIDPEFIKQIEKSVLSRFYSNNSSVIIITHNTAQALRLCRRIIFIKSGEIIFNDSVDNLLNSEDEYIKNYIATF